MFRLGVEQPYAENRQQRRRERREDKRGVEDPAEPPGEEPLQADEDGEQRGAEDCRPDPGVAGPGPPCPVCVLEDGGATRDRPADRRRAFGRGLHIGVTLRPPTTWSYPTR